MVANETLSQVSPSQPCSAQDCSAAPARVQATSCVSPQSLFSSFPWFQPSSLSCCFLGLPSTLLLHCFFLCCFLFLVCIPLHHIPGSLPQHLLSGFAQISLHERTAPSSDVKDASLPSVTTQLFYFQSGARHHPTHVFVVYLPTVRQKLLESRDSACWVAFCTSSTWPNSCAIMSVKQVNG